MNLKITITASLFTMTKSYIWDSSYGRVLVDDGKSFGQLLEADDVHECSDGSLFRKKDLSEDGCFLALVRGRYAIAHTLNVKETYFYPCMFVQYGLRNGPSDEYVPVTVVNFIN